MEYVDRLKRAVPAYGLNPETLIIEKRLQPNSWHGDLHFKIKINDQAFSARFISRKRYEHQDMPS